MRRFVFLAIKGHPTAKTTNVASTISRGARSRGARRSRSRRPHASHLAAGPPATVHFHQPSAELTHMPIVAEMMHAIVLPVDYEHIEEGEEGEEIEAGEAGEDGEEDEPGLARPRTCAIGH